MFFDTCIWISYFLKDKHFQKAEKLWKQELQPDDKVIITPLILHEIYDVVRKIIPQNFDPNKGDNPSDVSKEINDVMLKIAKFYAYHQKKGKVVYSSPELSLTIYNKDVLNIQNNYFGRVILDNKGKKFFYKGIGHWDIKHGLNGIILNIGTFYSLDQWMSDFSNIAKFSNINVVTSW